MNYHYYPGCSLEGTAAEYDLSTRAVMAALGAELTEIQGWTCCGASAAEATDAMLALVLPARNLALAEQAQEAFDILVPCSACYLNLRAVSERTRGNPRLLSRINAVLEADGLQLKNRLRVRHLLDVLATDFGPAAIRSRVTRPLEGLQFAPYYGCQCLRPFASFDDPELPTSMEPLITASGAGVFHWRSGGRCCGASHMNTQRAAGMELVAGILEAACGADAIVTVCPMCQMNLEGFQGAISRSARKDLRIGVLYLPQVIGLAMGLDADGVGLEMNLAFGEALKGRLAVA